MVRADVISHPKEWAFGGYNEIQFPCRKSILINYEKLAELSGCDSYTSFQSLHNNLVHDALETEKIKRESRWSQSIAVGEKQFVTRIKKRLGFKAVGRRIKPSGDGFQVREEIRPYISDFDAENSKIALKNTYK